MTTPRDLLIAAMDMEGVRSAERGDLSLALAGAEVIDLLDVHAVRLDGDQIVPVDRPATGDPLLDEAASSVARDTPHESLGDWLWRRGRGLYDTYLATLEAEGELTRERRHRWQLRPTEMVLADSPARNHAADRWAADEPVLAALAEAVGIRDKPPAEPAPPVTDGPMATVFAALDDALRELSDERERRAHRLDQAAVDNVQRGY